MNKARELLARLLKLDYLDAAEIEAYLAQPEATAAEPFCFAHATFEWKYRQSEATVKITRREQSEYGFTVPLYAHPAPAAAPRPTLTDAEIFDLWTHRESIHGGNIEPQLIDFARAVLAKAAKEQA
jgi:hypothetical protein